MNLGFFSMISSIFLEIIPYGTDLELNEISTPIKAPFYIIQNKNICFAIAILYKAEAHSLSYWMIS